MTDLPERAPSVRLRTALSLLRKINQGRVMRIDTTEWEQELRQIDKHGFIESQTS